MKQSLTIIATAVLLLLQTSCVKDVVMDAKEKPQVAVVCVLTDDPVGRDGIRVPAGWRVARGLCGQTWPQIPY